MIHIDTPNGPVTLNATPTDVTNNGGTLTITKAGTTVAVFRPTAWTAWRDTTTESTTGEQ